MRKVGFWLGALLGAGLILFVLKRDSSAPDPSTDKARRSLAPPAALAHAPTLNWTNATTRFRESSVVEKRESFNTAAQQKVIVEVVKIPSKYPYIRVETPFVFDNQAQAWQPQRPTEYVADQVLVQLKPGVAEKQLAAALKSVEGRVIQRHDTGEATLVLVGLPKPTVEAVPDALRHLTKFPELFQSVEPHLIRRASAVPNDPNYYQEWPLQKISAERAWDIQRGSAGVVVAVTDTGIDYNHPDLASRIWINTREKPNNHVDDDINGYVDDYRGYNFAYDNNNPYDDYDHGTFVSSLIGAAANDGFGIAGVCWDVRLMNVKIMDSFGLLFTMDEVRGYDYARVMGAKIVNASLGGDDYSQSEYDAISRLRGAGVLFVAAAGNDGRNNDVIPTYPASYPLDNIISVAYTDVNDALARDRVTGTLRASYGATTVDLAAPGVDVIGALPGGYYSDPSSGSSFAAPHVTGVAALLRAQNPGLTYLGIKAAILNNVDFIPAAKGKTMTGGRLNAYEALIPRIALSNALESGSLVWQTGGARGWFGQRMASWDGVDSARCGNIADGQTSWLQTTGAGPARLSFYWRVSSEFGFDELRFAVDGQVQSAISGETSWEQITYDVLSPGTHTFRWTYVKDASGSGGEDKAWLDHVSFVRDTAGPAITITSPVGTNLYASDVELDGTCTDLFGVASLEYYVSNGGAASPWQTPATSDNFANWQVQLSNLALGTNLVRFRAVDTLNHTSVASRTYVVLSPLTVNVSGCGSVDAKYAGTTWQLAGKTLNVRATSCAGNLFTGWSGDLTSSNAVLTFVMRPNLTLQPNFIVNPFTPVTGAYNGLFHEAAGVLHESSGLFKLSLTDTGAFTGSIICDGATNNFSGRFDPVSGQSSFVVPRTGKTTLSASLQLDFNDQLTGQIGNGVWTADVLADRLVFNAATNPPPFAGMYTLVFPGAVDFTNSPGGDGYATATVNTNGRVSIDGRMGDSTRLLQTIGVSKNGDWAFYVPLYPNSKGSVLGWLKFLVPPGFTNQLTSWIKPSITAAVYYPHGFSNELIVVGSPYAVPTGTRIIDCTNALLILSGANFADPITNQMVLTASNTVLNSGPYNAAMKIARTNGTFSGSLVLPAKRTNVFQGIFLQQQSIGLGYFLGSNYIGEVRFEPVP